MPDDELLERLQHFHHNAFPQYRAQFQALVQDGQHPTTLFIGCSDSRLLPYLLTGAGPGELFLVRNVGAFVPPYDGSHGHHGTTAAIEYATLTLNVQRIVVCGHSHCGAVQALYQGVPDEAINLRRWLDLGRAAVLPQPCCAQVLRRTEQRAVVLQLERLLDYPMVRQRVQQGQLTLHGWHYVIEEGQVYVFDVASGGFIAASQAAHSGTMPCQSYPPYVEHDGQVLADF